MENNGKVLTEQEILEGRSSKYKFIDFNKTLETAANELYPDVGYSEEMYCDFGIYDRSIFIEGAKWQHERSYSEEEVLQIIDMSRRIKDSKDIFDLENMLGLTEISTSNWEFFSNEDILEQFKKK